MEQDLANIHQDMEAMDIDDAGWVGDAPSEDVIIESLAEAHYGGYGVPLKPEDMGFKEYMELVRAAMEDKRHEKHTLSASHKAEKENRKRAEEEREAEKRRKKKERKWRGKLSVPRGPRYANGQFRRVDFGGVQGPWVPAGWPPGEDGRVDEGEGWEVGEWVWPVGWEGRMAERQQGEEGGGSQRQQEETAPAGMSFQLAFRPVRDRE